MKLTGFEAINYAELNGLALNEGLTASEARSVAREDPSLIWIELNDEEDDEMVRCSACGESCKSEDATRDEGSIYCSACVPDGFEEAAGGLPRNSYLQAANPF